MRAPGWIVDAWILLVVLMSAGLRLRVTRRLEKDARAHAREAPFRGAGCKASFEAQHP